MKKIIPYSELITCDCCGCELESRSKGWFGILKKTKYIRFNTHIKVSRRSVYGNAVYHLCPTCEDRIFEKVKEEVKEKKEQRK